MKKKPWGLAALSALLVALLAWMAPVAAADVDQRIKALEDELTRLKAEQQQVRTEQMELKNAATAAEEKLPTFEYEPGDGLTITGADKSWAVNFSFRVNVHSTIYPDGRPHAFDPVAGEDVDLDATSFELAPRRNRFYFLNNG